MSGRRSYAIGTGLFILLGFAALAYLSTQTTSFGAAQGATFDVYGDFSNIGQLAVRAPVKLAGVRIGSVSAIDLDRKQGLQARVTLSIEKKYEGVLPDDSSASILTNGLLGDQFVGLALGGSPDKLKQGDELVLTQSALQLEDLIGKFLTNSSSNNSNGNGGNGSNVGGNAQKPAATTNSATPPASGKPVPTHPN